MKGLLPTEPFKDDSMPELMTRWQLDRPGRQHLELVRVQRPQPGPGQLLIQVAAVSLNYRDLLLIDQGLGYEGEAGASFTPASDLAGTVVACGAGVTRFEAGDAVVSTFIPGWIDGPGLGTARAPNADVLGNGRFTGALAPYVLLDQHWAVSAPARLSPAQASTLPLAGLTAWTALVELGRVRPGDRVLVQGTGGVALFGLQIAAAQGAEVIVVSGDDAKLQRAKALGARHGINRHTTDWVQAVYGLTQDHGADHILEIVGGPHLGRSLEAAAVGGRISLIGVLEGFELSGGFGPFARKNVSVQGVQVGHRRGLEALVRAVDSTGLQPVVDGEYAFEDLPAALAHMERGPFGKVVLRV
jgi:NADPH:quinone reductase-like Zn-dependent oxidoreductase